MTVEPTMLVSRTTHGAITVITLNRPERRNAVDGPTALVLSDAFQHFEYDASQSVAILCGTGNFCAGADLKAIADGPERRNRLSAEGDGPMGPTRRVLSKPVIAAIAGHAVAGGLELALWCDLRVAERSATLGVFCRRFGVPLIDGGTVRLPRLIGMSRALDLILTGRAVNAEEALQLGLINRLCDDGQALATAIALAEQIAAFPQVCLRNDRLSAHEQWDLSFHDAMQNEFARGMAVVGSGETQRGAQHFTSGKGRHGAG